MNFLEKYKRNIHNSLENLEDIKVLKAVDLLKNLNNGNQDEVNINGILNHLK